MIKHVSAVSQFSRMLSSGGCSHQLSQQVPIRGQHKQAAGSPQDLIRYWSTKSGRGSLVRDEFPHGDGVLLLRQAGSRLGGNPIKLIHCAAIIWGHSVLRRWERKEFW